MKKILSFTVFVLSCAFLFSEGSSLQKKFVSGNIQDKIQAVRSAGSKEVLVLSSLAMDFSMQNKEILGNSRELDLLAIEGIRAVSYDLGSKSTPAEKKELSDKLFSIYEKFPDENVKISVLGCVSLLNLKDSPFPYFLNEHLKSANVKKEKEALLKSMITTLGLIGNRDSFVILYLLYGEAAWASYNEEIKISVGKLMESSVPQAVSIIQTGNLSDCRRIFDIALKNEKFPKKSLADISENVLSRTINMYENNISKGQSLTNLQFEAFEVLSKLKWTRASGLSMAFFSSVKKEYEEGIFPEEKFVGVIENLPSIAPLESVQPFCSYLDECNAVMEKSINQSGVKKPAESIVLALINALGAIGDKNAFDTLLSVTYYTYSETVIKQARDALAGLRW